MGLFSRKKKPTQAEQQAAAAAQAAQQAAAAQAAHQAAAARAKAQHDAAAQQAAAQAAQRKAVADELRGKEDKSLVDISAKRKQIVQLEGAISRFEDERKLAVQAAVKARHAKRDAEMKAQLRNVKRLEARSKQYQNQIVMAQQQLDALEDAASQRRILQDNKDFVQNIDDMKLDEEEVGEALQDMRDALQNVNDVNLTVQADAKLNSSMYDMDDAEAELDALELELGAEPTDAIPNVPGEVPTLPAPMPSATSKQPSASTITQSEEEEIRRLEADIAL